MNLGETIYRLRTQRNLSQGDLADVLNVSRQSVSKWENNSAVPELDKLIKMSRLFGVTLDELVGSDPTPETENNAAPTGSHEPMRPGMEPRRITGIVLLGFGLLTFLVFAALSFVPNLAVDFAFSLLFSVPLILCGILCLCCRHHPGYLCALAYYLTAWLTLSVFVSSSNGAVVWIVRLAILAMGVLLLIYTAVRFKALQFHTATKAVIAVSLILTLIIHISSLMPPREAEAVPGTGGYEWDVSVSQD